MGNAIAVAALLLLSLSGILCKGGAGPRADLLPGGFSGKWLAEGTVLQIDDFVSNEEADELKFIADELFLLERGEDWEDDVYNTALPHGEHLKKWGTDIQELVMPTMFMFEERIANLTGIPMHKDETHMLFSRQKPGALPDGRFVKNVHQDKNGAKRRVVTVVMYLSSAASNADGGHTVFPQWPSLKPASGASQSGEDPVKDLSEIFTQAFEEGRRVLVPSKAAHPGLPPQTADAGSDWNDKALALVEAECALALKGRSHVLAVRPRKGRAVVIWSERQADGKPNTEAWHAACHAKKGEPRYAVQKFKEPVAGQAMVDKSEL